MSRRGLIVAALLALLLGLVIRAPAGLIIDALAPPSLESIGVTGSMWRGRVLSIDYAGVRVSPAEWQVQPLELLRGRLSAEISAQSSAGTIDGTVALRVGGRIIATDTRIKADLGTLTTRSPVGPARGDIEANLERVELADMWPVKLIGVVDLSALQYPASSAYVLGDYRLECADSGDETVACDVTDRGGDLEVTGTLLLAPDSSYEIAGTVRARPGAPPELTQGLTLLGRPDASGRYVIDQRGKLK